mgnify:CR=1 FL=1
MAKKASDKKDMKNLDATLQEKQRALEMTLSSIEKEFGKGTVMKLGEKTAMQVDTVPTGCLDLDMALGVGGIPRGRIIEVFGPESSGKTTVALHVVASVQKMGGAAAFIDAEHALDPAYAKNLGVNIDELYVSQPNCGEDALEIAEALLRSGAIDIVADGDRAFCIRNGHPMMSSITGTGCQLSAMTAAFVTANPDHPLEAAAAAVAAMGLAGEIACARLTEQDGNATYRNYIIDAIYRMTPEMLEKGANYEVR